MLPSESTANSSIHTSNNLHLSNAVAVTEDNTDLRRSSTLLCQLADLVNDLIGSGLEPRRWVAGVWDGGGRDTLALAVKTTHLE